MAETIQSGFGPILLAAQAHLRANVPALTVSPNLCKIVADDGKEVPQMNADQDVLLRAGSFSSFKLGVDAGRACMRLNRYLHLYPRNRLALDEGDRAAIWATDPTLGMLPWEELCAGCLAGFFPEDTSRNLLTATEIMISSGTDPVKTALDEQWGGSSVTFDVEYLFALNQTPWNPPIITTTSLASTTPGASYSAALAGTGGTTPYTWSVVGNLPTGLSIDSGSGTISGTVSSLQSVQQKWYFAVVLTDANGQKAAAFLFILVTSTITITPTTLPNGSFGADYSQQLTAHGGVSPYIFSMVSGSLPTGITLNGAGLISGTPGTINTESLQVDLIRIYRSYTADSADWSDSSGNGKTLTHIGATKKAQGKLTNGVRGNNLTGFTGSPLTGGTDPLSVALWFYLSNDNNFIFMFQNSFFSTYTPSITNATFDSGGGYALFNDNMTLDPIPGWHQIIITFDGTTGFMYLDGNLIDKELIVPDYDTSSNFTLMDISENTAGVYIISDIYIWERALTDGGVGAAAPLGLRDVIPVPIIPASGEVAQLWNNGSGLVIL